jgi:ribonuclease VapC
MVIDTSAVVAILKEEPGHEALRRAVGADVDPKMSAATAVELHLVLTGGVGLGPRAADTALRALGVRLIPVDDAQMASASRAHDRYGRGSGHPARLNFGDCLSYALATHLGESLLYVGDDFAHTDVRSAVSP